MTRRVSTAAHPPPIPNFDGSTPPLRSHLQVQRTPRATPAPPRTPMKNGQLLNLLDFDLPPAPTPRSAPTISVRELESVKAAFASQISALKATLSGREAEVEALKRAVGDAERRVGEAAEQLREERARREGAEKDKGEWERRGREFEDVLRKVRAEVVGGEEEREALAARCAEAEECAKEAEARAADAEEDARAARAAADVAAKTPIEGGENGAVFTAEQVQRQIDEKVHALSRELHAIYKKKHVTKVAGLKKGFEAKTREKTAALEARCAELDRQCEDLQAKLDGTLSGVLATTLVSALPAPSEGQGGVSAAQREQEREKMEAQAAAIEQARAELAGRDEELRATRAQFAGAMAALERERVEKGELVAAVDEMLALQADVSVLGVAVAAANTPLPAERGGAGDEGAAAALRRSAGPGPVAGAAQRPSGLARPRFGIPTPGRSGVAAPSGLARPQQAAGKSRMMSNIERMGGARCD
jgi:predicted  nucleic acid-binding Zn-ribbon protein